MQSCCQTQQSDQNPIFNNPLEAFKKSQREKILYTIMLPYDQTKPDYLATIDVDPNSLSYCKIINRLFMPEADDELHHFGWNACASCKSQNQHKYLILPSIKSGNIYIIDVTTDPKNPSFLKKIPGSNLSSKTNGGCYPHTVHCLPTGEVMISLMGNTSDQAQGGFALLDDKFEVKGRWEKEGQTPEYGYDFWYQPHHNVLVSTELGDPYSFMKGFIPDDIDGFYGKSVVFWDWTKKTIINKISLEDDSIAPLEVRFLHNPKASTGYIGVGVSSSLLKIYKEQDTWKIKKVLQLPHFKVKNWHFPDMTPMIGYIVISLDDKYLYASCWLQGCVNQYDITDSDNPQLVGQIYVGGCLRKGGNIITLDDSGNENLQYLHDIPTVQNHILQGGPDMLNLSRDGRRLYVTSSVLRPWDRQIYPEMVKQGGQMIRVDIDIEKGGLVLSQDFYVDLSNEVFGPTVAHESRYPGGDCTSDIYS